MKVCGRCEKSFEITDDCGWKHRIQTERDITAEEIEMLVPHVRHAREIKEENDESK